MVMQLLTDSNASNSGVLSIRRRRRSAQRSSTLARVISDRECNNVPSFAPSYHSFGRRIGVFRQHYPHFAVGPWCRLCSWYRMIDRMIFLDVRRWIKSSTFYIPISFCWRNPSRSHAVNYLRRFGHRRWTSARPMSPTCALISWRWLSDKADRSQRTWIVCMSSLPLLLVLEMQFERALNSSISQTGLRIPSKPSFFTQSLWSLSSRTLTERSCCRCRLECEENVLIDYDLSNSFHTSWWHSFLTLTPTLPKESYIVLKERLLSLPAGVIRKWGDMLMTSDLACEHEAYVYSVIHSLKNVIGEEWKNIPLKPRSIWHGWSLILILVLSYWSLEREKSLSEMLFRTVWISVSTPAVLVYSSSPRIFSVALCIIASIRSFGIVLPSCTNLFYSDLCPL